MAPVAQTAAKNSADKRARAELVRANVDSVKSGPEYNMLLLKRNRAGEKPADIARATGLTLSAVYQRISHARLRKGKSTKSSLRARAHQRNMDILQKYERGHRVEDLAKAYRMTPRGMYKRLNEARKASGAPTFAIQKKTEDVAEVGGDNRAHFAYLHGRIEQLESMLKQIVALAIGSGTLARAERT